jgi:zinc protease
LVPVDPKETTMEQRSRVAALALAAGLLLGLSGPGAFAQGPTAPRKVVTIEGISEYRLDNGLRVLLVPDPTTNSVLVNLTVLVGSRHEGYGETGMAHLLEHMVFKGTPTHPDVPKALRDHGANFNGTTNFDRTNYFETMPATDANLEFGVRLEADRLVNSHVKREDLLKEFTVVRNEFERGENSPEGVLNQRMMAAAFEWHNYGKSTIGNRTDIERVPIHNLQAFYRKFYQPDNAVLIVGGKFDEQKALNYVATYFGAIKRPERRLDDTYTEEPAQDGERVTILRRVGRGGVAGVLYHVPAGSHEDFPAVQLLADVLSRQPDGRLYRTLVSTKKATSVSGGAQGLHDPGVVEFTARTDSAEGLDAVRDALIATVEGAADRPFTDLEVERARTRVLNRLERTRESGTALAMSLSQWMAQGDWRLLFVYRDRVAAVRPADLTRVARHYLLQSNRTVGLFIPSDSPQRAAVPPRPDVVALVKDYKGKADVARGEAFDPTPENLARRVLESKLPAGIRVALLPKKTTGEQVTATLVLRYGSAESLKGNEAAARALGQMMLAGTTKHTRAQLRDELERLQASITLGAGFGGFRGRRGGGGGPGGAPGELRFTITAKRATLPQVLALLGEILREPAFPAEEFDVMKRMTKDFARRGLTEPSLLAQEALRRKLSPYPKGDVRYARTMEESLAEADALTLEQVRGVYKNQLGAASGEFVAVGDFDPAALTKQLEDILKGWAPGVKYERIPAKAFPEVTGERIVIDTPDKANATYLAGLTLALREDDADVPALQVANLLFGGSTLSSRIGNRVRQKEGLSYGTSSALAVGTLDREGRFQIVAICNPENIDKVEKAIAEELERFLKDGVEAKELEDAKKAFVEARKVGRGSDGALVGQLLNHLHLGRPYDYNEQVEKKVLALTPEAVNAVVRKYLDPKRLVIVRAGDFRAKTSGGGR